MITIENKGFEIFSRLKFLSEAKNVVTSVDLFFTDKIIFTRISSPFDFQTLKWRGSEMKRGQIWNSQFERVRKSKGAKYEKMGRKLETD